MRGTFQRFMEHQLDYFRVPGATAAVIRGDRTEIFSFGVKDIDAGDTPENRVGPDTLFTLASVSKSFNAALIACLVDEGLLDWDQPVRTWVPELRMMDPEADKNLCLRDMLCHRSGLANHDAIWPSEAGHASMAVGLRYLEPDQNFRSVYQYNNTMYVMAGHVAEAVTGKPWSRLLREYILDPLGMDRTGSQLADMIASGDFAEPHKFIHGRVTRVDRWAMDEAAAAAGVNSCARDMVRWLRFHLCGGLNERGERLISEKNFTEMHRAQIVCGEETSIPGIVDTGAYAFGWHPGTYRGHRYWTHTGHIEGYVTIQSILPDDDIGVFLSMNLHDACSDVLRRAVYTVLDDLLGFEKDWSDNIRRYDRCPDWRYMENHLDNTPLATFPCDCFFPPEALAGTYLHPGYGPLRIRTENGRLYVCYHFRQDELLPLRGSTWYAEDFMEDTWMVRMPFEFLPDACGTGITAVRIPLEKKVSPILFKKAGA